MTVNSDCLWLNIYDSASYYVAYWTTYHCLVTSQNTLIIQSSIEVYPSIQRYLVLWSTNTKNIKTEKNKLYIWLVDHHEYHVCILKAVRVLTHYQTFVRKKKVHYPLPIYCSTIDLSVKLFNHLSISVNPSMNPSIHPNLCDQLDVKCAWGNL